MFKFFRWQKFIASQMNLLVAVSTSISPYFIRCLTLIRSIYTLHSFEMVFQLILKIWNDLVVRVQIVPFNNLNPFWRSLTALTLRPMSQIRSILSILMYFMFSVMYERRVGGGVCFYCAIHRRAHRVALNLDKLKRWAIVRFPLAARMRAALGINFIFIAACRRWTQHLLSIPLYERYFCVCVTMNGNLCHRMHATILNYYYVFEWRTTRHFEFSNLISRFIQFNLKFTIVYRNEPNVLTAHSFFYISFHWRRKDGEPL